MVRQLLEYSLNLTVWLLGGNSERPISPLKAIAHDNFLLSCSLVLSPSLVTGQIRQDTNIAAGRCLFPPGSPKVVTLSDCWAIESKTSQILRPCDYLHKCWTCKCMCWTCPLHIICQVLSVCADMGVKYYQCVCACLWVRVCTCARTRADGCIEGLCIDCVLVVY